MTDAINYVIMGLTLGLAAGISPGPLLTLVITRPLQHNKTEGIKIALAPLFTDAPIVIISIFLLSLILLKIYKPTTFLHTRNHCQSIMTLVFAVIVLVVIAENPKRNLFFFVLAYILFGLLANIFKWRKCVEFQFEER